jgi:sigma-B regulation protein RsbU (phosphoserine phosphatase)
MAAAHDVAYLHAANCRKACDPALMGKVDAVVVCPPMLDPTDPGRDHDPFWAELELLADALRTYRLTGVLLTPSPEWAPDACRESLAPVSTDVSADELWGRVATVQQYRPLLQQRDEHVAVMQRLGKKLTQQFVEVDQELRLASRLQRDFLPRRLPEIGPYRFAALYRPASWVSGDTYDVRRLDETHIGFYVADAVGHSIAAGLLTMFIRQAVVGKNIDGDDYTLVCPSEVLATLNRELARQDLPNCQFVTACYGRLDTETGRLEFARAGHPHPIHISAKGLCREVHTVGGLLGVFPEETYPATALQLEPGDKFIIYSDGLESTIIAGRDRQQDAVNFTDGFLRSARQPVKSCIQAIESGIDHAEGSLTPADDMTVLALERLAE